MAVRLLSQEVSDLCIGKQPLKSLPASATTVADALAALKRCREPYLAVLDKKGVVGKLCVADIICYLCSEDNIRGPAEALARPVSVLLCRDLGLVRRVEPNVSISEAIDAILEGVHMLVVPLLSGSRKRPPGGPAGDLCWLTQEDFIRYFLNSIGVFYHVATQSIEALCLIRPAGDFSVRHYNSALSALPVIRRALTEQTAVAVVGDDGKMYGEISPLGFASAGDHMAAAIATLSAGDLMAYINYHGYAPEGLLRAIQAGLKEKGLNGLLGLMDGDSFSDTTASLSVSSSSSDEESAPHSRSRKMRSRSWSLSGGRQSEEPAVCYPGSSLVAVMVQALAQGVRYLWVVDEADCSLVGIVTFVDMLRVLR